MSAEQSILTIALYAAFADGLKTDAERDEVRRIASSLASGGHSVDLASLYQDVLLKRISIESAASKLSGPDERQLAYEMAVCVCDADGRQSDGERRFLAELQQHLRLQPELAAASESHANAIVDLTDAAAPPATGTLVVPDSTPVAAATATTAALDQSILKFAMVCGGLELLPQSWASLAIIPLQIKMVYGIGKAHGVALDQGHIKEFIGAAGIGLSSQYLEQVGRKLLGGLLRTVAGGTIGKVGSAGTGMAFSFATTYALGQLAKRYYAGGRVMSTSLLRETFQSLLQQAKDIQTQHAPQIQQQAQNLDLKRVAEMIKGT